MKQSHPIADEFTAECNVYRASLSRVTLSMPDGWNARRVVDAMAATRELNGLDELPHDPPPVVRPVSVQRVERPVPVSSDAAG